jgi:2-oxo-4-hydroxy-4-carboxy-5-ureidoimidazoline decarboxylase
MITLADVNKMSAAKFVAAFGDIAEHSSWVAELAFKSPHPPVGTFSHLQEQTGEGSTYQPSPVPLGMGEGGRRPEEGSFLTRGDLIARFTHVVLTAPKAQQLALLRAHPDLATRAKLTADSTHEQKGAGLDMLSADEFAKFTALNNQYKAQNGFPFIFAVKGATKQQILASFEERMDHAHDVEFQVALQQVCKIIGFRLEARVSE